MKVLIDKCAPKALKVALAASGFDCTTVQEAGWSDHSRGVVVEVWWRPQIRRWSRDSGR
jgi:hypothetical protein